MTGRIALALLFATSLAYGQESTTQSAVVERGDLVITAAAKGHLATAAETAVWFRPQAHAGPYRVAEVVHARGAVRAGAVLVRLRADDLALALQSAQAEMMRQREQLTLAKRDLELVRASNEIALTKAEIALADTKTALETFTRVGGPKMLRSAELEIESRKIRLANQKEELAQLEGLYKGTHLAPATKEIVLERARRDVSLAEAWLAIALADKDVVVNTRFPQLQRDVQNNVRWRSEALKRLREQIRIDGIRREMDLVVAEEKFKASQRHRAKLEADVDVVEIKAPATGLVTGLDLVVNDCVRAQQRIATIVDPSSLVARVALPAKGLRHVRAGTTAALRLTAFPEVVLTAYVTHLGFQGARQENATVFTTELAFTKPLPELARPGLAVRARFHHTLANVVSVPKEAIFRDNDGSVVYVVTANGTVSRDVVTGASSANRTHISSGIEAGERVLLSKPKDADLVPEPPATKPLESQGPEQAEIERALERGLAYLLGAQNDNGSWGRFESSRTGEIYLGTVASHKAFCDATTALCISAVHELERSSGPAGLQASLVRAIRYLVNTPPAQRATGGTFYDTWTHAYAVEALAALAKQNKSEPALSKGVEMALRREVEILVERQAADGGWGYYDFGFALPTPTGEKSASFLTAVAILALRSAQEAGVEVEASVIADGLAVIERLRLPNGAYVYGTYAQFRPDALFNWPKGSLGRSQPCNLALWQYGQIDSTGLHQGLEALVTNHTFLQIGKGRPYPHEAWYYTAGYYYLFGHYYAARVIDALPQEEQARYKNWLARVMVDNQNDDGSWTDYPLYGYHKAYGTAFALMTLQRCRQS